MQQPDEQLLRIFRELETVRNVTPAAFNRVIDPNAPIKERWKLFDEIYDAVEKRLVAQGTPIECPTPEMLNNLPEEERPLHIARGKRQLVAAAMMSYAFPSDDAGQVSILIEAANLVPPVVRPYDPKPSATPMDFELLRLSIAATNKVLEEEWYCFFRCDEEPVEKRKAAFQKFYGVASTVWKKESLLARSLEPKQRQKQMILGMMCFVPHDQWSQTDLEQLWEEMVPVEEPPADLGQQVD